MPKQQPQHSASASASKAPLPIRRVGDMQLPNGDWVELGMRFRNGKPRGTQMYFRERPNPVTEGPATGKGIWKPLYV